MRPELPLAMALVTDGAETSTAGVLRDAGVDVVGLLGPEPLESLAWAAEAGARRAYPEMGALLSDEVEAVCIEVGVPSSDVVARHVVGAGLHLLLARPQTAGVDALRDVADAAEDADVAHAVAMDGRAWAAAQHVQRAMPALGRLRQVTVLDAPEGDAGRAEVVDLVLRWCGDVLAVCADPTAMPAPELTPGADVTLALLTGSGATVLVHERPGGVLSSARITLVGSAMRVLVSGRVVRRQDANGVRDVTLPAPPSRSGLIEATYDVLRAAEFADAGLVRGATLHDLLAVVRVLDAIETSTRHGGWIEL
jgi:hypothetical protein